MSVTERGGALPPARRKATTWVVAGASLLLLGLGATSLMRQSRRPSAGTTVDVVGSLDAPPTGGGEPSVVLDDPRPRNTAGRSEAQVPPPEPAVARPPAVVPTAPLAAAAAPRVVRSGARPHESVAAHGDAGAASGAPAGGPATTPTELAPPANTNPFDRRF